jgi:hypothetical protein
MNTMSTAIASDVEIAPAPARPLVKPLLLAAGCIALADWLLYGWQIGISLALFLAVLGIGPPGFGHGACNDIWLTIPT